MNESVSSRGDFDATLPRHSSPRTRRAAAVLLPDLVSFGAATSPSLPRRFIDRCFPLHLSLMVLSFAFSADRRIKADGAAPPYPYRGFRPLLIRPPPVLR